MGFRPFLPWPLSWGKICLGFPGMRPAWPAPGASSIWSAKYGGSGCCIWPASGQGTSASLLSSPPVQPDERRKARFKVTSLKENGKENAKVDANQNTQATVTTTTVADLTTSSLKGIQLGERPKLWRKGCQARTGKGRRTRRAAFARAKSVSSSCPLSFAGALAVPGPWPGSFPGGLFFYLPPPRDWRAFGVKNRRERGMSQR